MVRLWLVERDSVDGAGGMVDGGGDRAGACPLDSASRAHVVVAGSAANRMAVSFAHNIQMMGA